ncbi:hypothetical protein BD410DRAFT_807404 [Rickenella mellea]|uniref:Uncharacterized protein n=1 Tax=Rickenella mellea TaxID=50990 RepID=A0A4Y7PQR5_9AGAM|nr:hypothetical protein BD410DRAFT_807404 [Rickenella mellea]
MSREYFKTFSHHVKGPDRNSPARSDSRRTSTSNIETTKLSHCSIILPPFLSYLRYWRSFLITHVLRKTYSGSETVSSHYVQIYIYTYLQFVAMCIGIPYIPAILPYDERQLIVQNTLALVNCADIATYQSLLYGGKL